MDDLVSVPFSFLKPGMVLHASCSDADYGTIVAVNPATASGCVDSVDVEVNDLDDLLEHADMDDSPDVCLPDIGERVSKWWYEFPKDTKIVVRGVPVVRVTLRPINKYEAELGISPYNIELDTPGDGCYRCTKYFSIHNYEP